MKGKGLVVSSLLQEREELQGFVIEVDKGLTLFHCVCLPVVGAGL